MLFGLFASGSAVARNAAGTELSPGQLTQRARQASPEELAQAWLGADKMVRLAAVARGGASVVMQSPGREQTMDASNADALARTFQERRSIFEAEIKRRGFAAFAGSYTIHVADSCVAANAPAWLLNRSPQAKGNASTKFATQVRIRQQGFHVTLIDHAEDVRSGEALDIEMDGAAAESSFVLEDRFSGDILYAGRMTGRDITIRPMAELIQGTYSSYPGWIARPDANALRACTITLTAAKPPASRQGSRHRQ
ncbi:MAG TPA: hypothetical protein VFN42_02290 [Acetobacteraceae bacterium]|nr:hypothetical protein [Acetobacteraceae bacterium]